MTITELGCMGVKPGYPITDPSTPEGQVLPNAWGPVVTKPGGPQRVFWGLEEDDATKVWAFFDWDSVEQHETFAKTYGAEVVKDIPKVCTHGEFTKHIALTPSSHALAMPSTQIIIGYFPPNISADEKNTKLQQVETLLTEQVKYSLGWGLQDDFPVRGGTEKTGTMFMVLIGEESKEEQETPAREVGKVVKSMEGSIGFYEFVVQSIKINRPE